MRASPLQILGQAAVLGLFAALLGYLATRPAYVHMDPRDALVTLSFGHAGERKVPCRRLTPDEIAALPPNMRKPVDCPRERVDLLVELALDGRVLYRGSLPPSGLAGDGASTVFEEFPVAPGTYTLTARLRDTRREEGFDYETERTVSLAAGRRLVVDFRPDTGGFVIL